ncbi:MAG: alpha-rhamnosidase, partial [Alistipes sp.]|nr:alpha-rhamnosidase [Alistipes sp.]
TTPGYATYEVRPVLGGLEWMEGTIPTPQGEIYVSVTPHEVRVRATAGEGLLYLPGQADPVKIEAGVERVVTY